jgi:hypothetical protein
VKNRADVFNTINGYQYLPPREDRIIVPPGDVLVVSLETAPSSLAMSGTVAFEELW